ncbi:hypothetical protein Q5P01_017878 [Channa striata]|uniref:Uncharacterized protein n=1 Tax=Channa striata TaxID=64152 RepID=A0AA88M643_CHASR|nr:hypothetical protein Q5P01_017878 [Channa striata]
MRGALFKRDSRPVAGPPPSHDDRGFDPWFNCMLIADPEVECDPHELMKPELGSSDVVHGVGDGWNGTAPDLTSGEYITQKLESMTIQDVNDAQGDIYVESTCNTDKFSSGVQRVAARGAREGAEGVCAGLHVVETEALGFTEETLNVFLAQAKDDAHLLSVSPRRRTRTPRALMKDVALLCSTSRRELPRLDRRRRNSDSTRYASTGRFHRGSANLLDPKGSGSAVVYLFRKVEPLTEAEWVELRDGFETLGAKFAFTFKVKVSNWHVSDTSLTLDQDRTNEMMHEAVDRVHWAPYMHFTYNVYLRKVHMRCSEVHAYKPTRAPGAESAMFTRSDGTEGSC